MALTLVGSAAGSGRARRRRRGNERAAGSLGPGAEGAAAARRSLAGSHGGKAGKAAGGERPGSEAAPLPGPRGGAGSALGLPHRWRRRRLRCGSKPNMAAAAAALRTRGPRGGRAARGPRAHCALGRGSAAFERRRRRPRDMAGGRRRRQRRLRGALGGEARRLGSHPLRGGEEGAGASLGPARVTCPKHAHVTRAPRPSRRALARDVCSLVRGDCCSPSFWRLIRLPSLGSASRRLVPPPPHAQRSPQAPSPSPLKGCSRQPIRSPDARPLAATQLSAVNQQCAGRGSPKCQSTCQSAVGALHPLVRLFVGSFIRIANVPCSQPLLRQALCQVLRVTTRIPHTCLHLINQQIFIGNQPCIN